jgi:hypothetical protein
MGLIQNLWQSQMFLECNERRSIPRRGGDQWSMWGENQSPAVSREACPGVRSPHFDILQIVVRNFSITDE